MRSVRSSNFQRVSKLINQSPGTEVWATCSRHAVSGRLAKWSRPCPSSNTRKLTDKLSHWASCICVPRDGVKNLSNHESMSMTAGPFQAAPNVILHYSFINPTLIWSNSFFAFSFRTWRAYLYGLVRLIKYISSWNTLEQIPNSHLPCHTRNHPNLWRDFSSIWTDCLLHVVQSQESGGS